VLLIVPQKLFFFESWKKMGNSGHFKGRSRHIDLRYMFLSDYIARGLVKFERVDSKNQIADIGTAPRPWPVFQRHRPVLYGES
jgi:hypothetical protein